MHLAYRHGVDRIWIVNVGDIKPMELPTEYFLDYAWNPDAWPAERLAEYTRLWAAEQFPEQHAAEIADILARYAKYKARRKPEMLSPDTYSLANYREAETVVADYNRLAERAKRINEQLPAECRDAYYQLVLYPVKACENLNELYYVVAMNRLYAKQERAETNALAARARALFAKDAELSRYYNEAMAGGKWNHMMDQTHIGYTYWQQPDANAIPEVVEIDAPATAESDDASDDATEEGEHSPLDMAPSDPQTLELSPGSVFLESDGCVSMEAANFTRAIDVEPLRWQLIPDQGRTGSAMTRFPVTAASQTPSGESPQLEYRVNLTSSGDVKVLAYVSPTLDYYNDQSLRYALSIDDQPPQIVNLHADQSLPAWEKMVGDNINLTSTTHHVDKSGPQVLHFWRVDPGVVLQKLVIDTGGLAPSYLGPPQSQHRPEGTD